MKALDSPECVILGGGGHAKVLIDSMRLAGVPEPYCILDSNQDRWGEAVLGVPILGGDELLSQLIQHGTTSFVVGLGSVSNNRPRRRLFETGCSQGLEPLTVVHPSAICSKWAKIGPGSQILPGSIVNAGATLGANVIVNSGSIIEHDCVLEDHVHIATGARLASTIRVGAETHIGAGATIRQSITIGKGSVVGAGAVVVSDVASNTVVVGVPARPLVH